jgi:hypothetical protein
MHRTTALIAAGTLVATPLVMLAGAGAAHAETTKRGACGTGSYEFQVEREAGGFEIGLDLDRLAPGSRWTIVLKHDGKRVTRVTRSADAEGEIDVDAVRSNTAGTDTFRFKAKRSAGGVTCAATIRVS